MDKKHGSLQIRILISGCAVAERAWIPRNRSVWDLLRMGLRWDLSLKHLKYLTNNVNSAAFWEFAKIYIYIFDLTSSYSGFFPLISSPQAATHMWVWMTHKLPFARDYAVLSASASSDKRINQLLKTLQKENLNWNTLSLVPQSPVANLARPAFQSLCQGESSSRLNQETFRFSLISHTLKKKKCLLMQLNPRTLATLLWVA